MVTADVTSVPTKVDRSKIVFPRKHLVTGERVLWEGRPSIVVYFVRAMALFIIGTIVTTLLYVLTQADKTSIDLIIPVTIAILCIALIATHRRWGGLEGGLGLLLLAAIVVMKFADISGFPAILVILPMIIGLIAFLIHLIEWMHTAFAMTDRRIMTQYGVFDIRFGDTHIDRVQNVTVMQTFSERLLGIGDIMFATSGEMGGLRSDDPSERMKAGGAMIWENIPKPFVVRKKAEEIIYRGPITYPPTGNGGMQPAALGDTQARMAELAKMREDGLISETEYEAKRKEILGRL